jgi:predicted ArsR family transcriptional regulator
MVAAMITSEVEKQTGEAQPREQPTGAKLRALEALRDHGCATVSTLGTALSITTPALRASLRGLVGAGFVEEAGPIPTGARFAQTYRLTALGQSMLLGPTPEEPPAEQRARAIVYLASNGVGAEEAIAAVDAEEASSRIGGCRPDYSLDFWKNWLREHRASEDTTK